MKCRISRWRFLVVAATVSAVAASAQQPSPPPPIPAPNAVPNLAAAQEPSLQSPQFTDPILTECLGLIEKHEYPEAELRIRTNLRKHPDSAEAHFLLGYALYRQNKPRESLAEYTTGAQLHKPAANDLAVVAMDYILLRDYVDADRWLTQATAWSPNVELYWYYLGRTKYAENRFDEAIAAFTKCLALAPRDLRAEYNLGLSYAGINRNDEAAAAFRTAIAWETDSTVQDPQPYLDLGILLLDQAKPDQALSPLQKAVSLDPQNPRAHEELSRTWEQLKNLPKADAEMHAALSLAPDIPSLHFEMGRIFQQEGMSAKAKDEFARCEALTAAHSTDSAETPNPAPPNERQPN